MTAHSAHRCSQKVVTGKHNNKCKWAGGVRTLREDVAGEHEEDDQEARADRVGDHHVARQRRKHAEHGQRVAVHQEQDQVEAQEPARGGARTSGMHRHHGVHCTMNRNAEGEEPFAEQAGQARCLLCNRAPRRDTKHIKVSNAHHWTALDDRANCKQQSSMPLLCRHGVLCGKRIESGT